MQTQPPVEGVAAEKADGAAEQEEQEDEEQGESLSIFDAYLDNPPNCALWPEGREECPQCGKKGRFYCPDCLVFVGKPDEVDVPLGLRLPLQVGFGVLWGVLLLYYDRKIL